MTTSGDAVIVVMDGLYDDKDSDIYIAVSLDSGLLPLPNFYLDF